MLPFCVASFPGGTVVSFGFDWLPGGTVGSFLFVLLSEGVAIVFVGAAVPFFVASVTGDTVLPLCVT